MTDHHYPIYAPGTQARDSLATRLVDTLLSWMERAQTRHILSGLTETELKDIGLSRGDIDHEAGKPFWRR